MTKSLSKCSSLLFFKFGHKALKFLEVIRLVAVQDSVVIKTVNENLRLSSSSSVPSICGRMYRRNLSGRRLRLICDRLKTGCAASPSTKGSFLPLLRRSTNEPERQKTNFHRVDTSDSCVNTLIVANFNLLSRAIQGDTQRFEHIERFIKVRNSHENEFLPASF